MNSTLRPVTLLYLEDNIEIRQHLTRYLQRNGYTVLEADNVNKACDLFHDNHIDIALVDLHLPKQNGMEFVRRLRHKGISVPVIITTAYTEKEYLLDAINLDVTRYLVKPFKKSELIDAISISMLRLPAAGDDRFHELGNGYRYDPINKSVIFPDAQTVQLSKKEYLLMELLLQRKNQIVGYDTIEADVWKNTPMSIDALRTLVRGLRKKIHPDIIRNINRIGYRIGL